MKNVCITHLALALSIAAGMAMAAEETSARRAQVVDKGKTTKPAATRPANSEIPAAAVTTRRPGAAGIDKPVVTQEAPGKSTAAAKPGGGREIPVGQGKPTDRKCNQNTKECPKGIRR